MERLTRRINGVVVYVGAKNPYSTGQIPCEVEPAGVREMMDRLAAYEDTGLEPREVSAIVKEWSDLCTVIGECGGIDRLRELAEADKDGRLVVLPCKVGDTVYRIFNPPSREPVISAHTLMSVDYIGRWIDKFGKTVFLTREEAEKALEAMKNGN